jgi:hypothetical protein
MGVYLNGHKTAAYLNGKRVGAYLNGKLIWGGKVLPLTLDPTELIWKGVESGSSSFKNVTISGGKSPFILSNIPSWATASIEGALGTHIAVYPNSQNTGTSNRTGTITVTDVRGNSATLTVTQGIMAIFFVIVGNGNIMYTDDGGQTWV